MEKLHFEIHIQATPEKVWNTMLSDETYRQWTSVFNPGGSYFNGDWSEGSKILFLGPNPDGSGEGGMVSRINENRLHEFISIEHVGFMKDGLEDTTSDEVKKWVPSFENYTFVEKEGGTDVLVDMDITDAFKGMFDDTWPKGLLLLKELCEK